MNIESTYLNVRNRVWLSRVVFLLRYLIGFAFIPSGMKKLLGLRFTSIGIDNPIGFFFEAMYQTGFYWNFLGFGQVLAALLLMTQRFATVGAVLFSFIVVNVWIITVSMHFTGTWLITSLMMFACICLLLWDYNKLQFIVMPDTFAGNKNYNGLPTHTRAWEVAGLLLFTASVLLSLTTRYI